MVLLKKIAQKIKRDGFFKFSIAILIYPFQIKKKLEYQKMLKKDSLDDRFDLIYQNNLWSSNESISGSGSEIAYTESLRNWMVTKIDDLKIEIIVDAPCGDFNWMKLVTKKVDIYYFGIDIVKDLIKTNISLYQDEQIKFSVGNICEDPLPSCDILMVRDCLFHLSYNDIQKFLQNISKTDYKYLLTTSHIVNSEFDNSDIISGDFREINLFMHPFNFDKQHIFDRVRDCPQDYHTPREMVLIKKENVPNNLNI